MSKLYVFAIGGSGSRVLRSLTMLLSSGVHTNYEIVPMIVPQSGLAQEQAQILIIYQKNILYEHRY